MRMPHAGPPGSSGCGSASSVHARPANAVEQHHGQRQRLPGQRSQLTGRRQTGGVVRVISPAAAMPPSTFRTCPVV